jgi:hypothetical protein
MEVGCGAGKGWRSVRQICKKNKKVLRGVMEKWNVLHTINRKKANWIDHIWLRKYLLKHVIEDRMEGRSDGRKRKKT